MNCFHIPIPCKFFNTKKVISLKRKKSRILSAALLRRLSEESQSLGPANCQLISLQYRSSIRRKVLFTSTLKMYENISSDEDDEIVTKQKTLTPRSSQGCSRTRSSSQIPEVVLTAAPEEKHNMYDLRSRRSSRSNSTLTLQPSRTAKRESIPKFDSLRINVIDLDSSSKLDRWATDAPGRKTKDAEVPDYDTKIRKLMRRKSSDSPSSWKGEKRSRSCYPETSSSTTAFTFTATMTEVNIPNKENHVMTSSTPILQKMQPKRTESTSKEKSGDGNGVNDPSGLKLRGRSSSAKNKMRGYPTIGSGGSSNNKTNRLIIEGMIDVRESKTSSTQKFWFSLFSNEMLIAKQAGKKLKPEKKVLISDLWCWESTPSETDVGKCEQLELHLGWPMKSITLVFEMPHDKSLWKASFDSCILNSNNVQCKCMREELIPLTVAVKYGDQTKELEISNPFVTGNELLQQSSNLFDGAFFQTTTHFLSCLYGKKLSNKLQLHGHEKIYSIVKHAMNEYNLLALQGLTNNDKSSSKGKSNSSSASASASSSSGHAVVMFCITDKNERPQSSDGSAKSRGDPRSSPSGNRNFFMNGLSIVSAKGARIRGRSLDRAAGNNGAFGGTKLNSWIKGSREKSSTAANRSRKNSDFMGLFGVPLEKLCDQIQCNESTVILPAPILKLLYHLYSRGIYQEGVFRKASRRVDKTAHIEKLNRGEDVNFEEMQVFLMADLLKEFLRLLPSCVLLSENFCMWTNLMEEKDEDLRIQNISQVLYALPKCNFDLATRVFFILSSVIKCQPEIKASAMSTCVAPSVLFPQNQTPMSCGSFEANQIVAELIGHYEEIVGPKMLSQIEREFMERAKEFETKNRNDTSFTSSPSPTSHDSGIGQNSLSSLDLHSSGMSSLNGLSRSPSKVVDKQKWLQFDRSCNEEHHKLLAPVSASTPVSPKTTPRIMKSNQGASTPGSNCRESMESRLSWRRAETPSSDDSRPSNRKNSWQLLTQQLLDSSYSFDQDAMNGSMTSSRSSTPLANSSKLLNGHRPRIQTLPSKPMIVDVPKAPFRKASSPPESSTNNQGATSSPEVSSQRYPKEERVTQSKKSQAVLNWQLGSQC